MRRAALACLALVCLLAAAPAPAAAEIPEDFVKRVQAAYRSADKTAALRALFRLEGVDPETLAMYDGRIIGRMMAKYDNPSVGLAPLGEDFVAVQVMRGYEYRPNLTVLGYVVIDGNTHVPYGAHQGRHYFTAMTRKAILPAPPPDKMLQMLVMGLDSRAVRFEGWCDVMLANGQLRRMAVEDGGAGGRTVMIMAQHVAACEIANRSGRGALQLRILEGQTEIFKTRIEPPETTLTYRRPEGG